MLPVPSISFQHKDLRNLSNCFLSFVKIALANRLKIVVKEASFTWQAEIGRIPKPVGLYC